jgi:hypothetical protein
MATTPGSLVSPTQIALALLHLQLAAVSSWFLACRCTDIVVAWPRKRPEFTSLMALRRAAASLIPRLLSQQAAPTAASSLLAQERLASSSSTPADARRGKLLNKN